MKRKSATRWHWPRILKQRFTMLPVDTSEFTGYVSLASLDEVKTPLWKHYHGEDICLVDNGYLWMQHFPRGEHYALTSIFNAQHEHVRWYVDICNRNYIDEQGDLYFEDLYLDLDVAPDRRIVVLDADELDEALGDGLVSPDQYALAWCELERVKGLIIEDRFPLLHLVEEHLQVLLQRLVQGGHNSRNLG